MSGGFLIDKVGNGFIPCCQGEGGGQNKFLVSNFCKMNHLKVSNT